MTQQPWPSPHVSAPAPAQPAAPKGSRLLALVLGMVVVAVAGAVAAGYFAFAMMSSARGSKNVGELEALAPVQAQIRGLSGCRFTYNTDRKRTYNDAIAIYPCRGNFPAGARLPVPAGFKYKHLRFEGKRSSPSEPWDIFVDTTAVSFPELQAALTELAPIMARDYEAA